MAFGVHPKYIQEIPYHGVSKSVALCSAYLAVTEIGWNTSNIESNGFCAYVNNFAGTLSEKIWIVIDEVCIRISSASITESLTDNGRNKDNVVKFGVYFANFLSQKELPFFEQANSEIKLKQSNSTLVFPFNRRSVRTSTRFWSFFVPQDGYFITPILIHLNLGIFLLMIIFGYNPFLPNMEFLVSWGANFRPVTVAGEWWRLITAVFLHINLLHLLMNMIALAFVGVLLESILGKLRFAMAYILTGFSASICSFWWYDFTVSIGASGAIFGLFGVFLALLFTDFIEPKARKQLLFSIIAFVITNLVTGVIYVGVDNAAHVGGLIGGIVVGFSFLVSLKKPLSYKIKGGSIFLVTFLFFLVIVGVLWKTPNDLPTYDKLINEAIWCENAAILPPETEKLLTNDQIIGRIDVSKIYWERAIRKVKMADRLSIPAFLHQRNKLQIDFYLHQLDYEELLKKKLSQEMTAYDGKMSEIKFTLDSLRSQIELYSSPK